MIKKFNEYYNISSYEEISKVDFHVITADSDKWVDFTKKQLEEIKLIDDTFHTGTVFNPKYKYQVISNNYDHIIVYKLEDEWFYIEYSPLFGTRREYYKCDQFDGLIECLKKISL